MIKVIDVSKSFGENKVLNKASLTVNDGETFLIIGRSGAGKTVLLRSIIGLIQPDSGEILVDNQDITHIDKNSLNKIRSKIGVVFQGNALFDFLTVEENVGFMLYQHSNLSRGAIREKVKETLELVGMKGIEDLRPYELSGGMRKRVAVARAIIYNPRVVVYDEPTTGVDPIAVDKVVSLVENLHHTLSTTSIIVTHDLHVGLKLADRLAFLLGGRIIFEGTKEELEHLKDERIIQFMRGSSKGPIKETEV